MPRGPTMASTGSSTTSSSSSTRYGAVVRRKKVAAYGYNLLLDQFAPVAQIAERIAFFKAEVEAQGRVFDPMSVAVIKYRPTGNSIR